MSDDQRQPSPRRRPSPRPASGVPAQAQPLRRPSPHPSPVRLDTLQADDELLDALGRDLQVPDGDPLVAMLRAWRADLDADPFPAADLDLTRPDLPAIDPAGVDAARIDPAPAAVAGPRDAAPHDAAPHPSAGRVYRFTRARRAPAPHPRGLRLAVAAALVVAAAGGVSVAAADARPTSPLWPVVRIVHPDVADARAAQDAIDRARAALDAHRYDDAAQLLDQAQALITKVGDDQQRRQLTDQLDALRAALRAAPRTHPPSAGAGSGSSGSGQRGGAGPSAGVGTPGPAAGGGSSTGASAPPAGAGGGAGASPTPSSSPAPGLLPLPLPSLPLPLPLNSLLPGLVG